MEALDPLSQADLAMGLTWAPRRSTAEQAGHGAAAARVPPADRASSASGAASRADAAPEAARPHASAPPPTESIRRAEPTARGPEIAAAATDPSSVVLHARLPAHGRSRVLADRGQREQALQELRERHDRECPHCTTATAHTRTVFGEGDPMARLVFVGEAPGETEDRTGRPFVGRAGEKLDEMIRAMGLSREQVYIANVLKSRPPENRTPLQHEVDGCGPYLIEQLLVLRPEVIVTLGGPATKLLLGTDTGITRLRGVWSQWNPPAGLGEAIAVMPTYHPAYLLRNYTPKTRAEVWSDLQAVMQRLGLSASRKSAG